MRAVPLELDVGGGQVTSPAAVDVRRQVVALGHAVLVGQTADVVSVVIVHVILAEVESTAQRASAERTNGDRRSVGDLPYCNYPMW